MFKTGTQVVYNRRRGFGQGVVVGGEGNTSHVVWHSGRRWADDDYGDDGAVWWVPEERLVEVKHA